MTYRTLICRSLRYHWRSHLGVVVGAAMGSAALIGALVVGDSVKGSLREQALERLAGTWVALEAGDRFFQKDLAGRMFEADTNHIRSTVVHSGSELFFLPRESGALGAVVVLLPTSVSTQDGSARANHASLFAVDPTIWPTEFEGADLPPFGGNEEVWLNDQLASHLRVKVGDTIILRVNKPSAIGLDAPVSPHAEASVAVRVLVGWIVPAPIGNLSLMPGGTVPMNIFVPFSLLEEAVGVEGRGNVILLPPAYHTRDATAIETLRQDPIFRQPKHFFTFNWLNSTGLKTGVNATATETAEFASRLLADAWNLGDTESELIQLTNGQPGLELRTSRVFLDPPIERAALEADTNAQPIITYIANLITLGTNQTPYSMVTAAGAPWTPSDLRDDEILMNQWLADDLQAKPGDQVSLVYYDPESGARLIERTNTFRVHGIVPMEMPWADRTLMPEFPGVEKAESTKDWDTAFPLTYEILPNDDEYWREYRGTPKAFITLAAGKNMWSNRFGELTAIRFPVPMNDAVGTRSTSSQTNHNGDAVERVPTRPADYREALEQKVLSNLDPAELGLRFEPVREQALKAAQGAQDFGGLFIGFSLFLIVAALILMALLFQFGLEQRASELGTLLALGFTHKQVRRLLLGEGAALAFVGGVIGVVGGVLYARAMLLGLRTVWRDAVGGTTLDFFVTPTSLVIGLFASTLVAVFTIWLALRKQSKRPAIVLLNSRLGDVMWNASSVLSTPGRQGRAKSATATDAKSDLPARRRKHVWNAVTIGIASLILAVGLVAWALVTGDTTNAGVFFGAGALVLIGGLAITAWRLRRSANVLPTSRRQIQPNDSSAQIDKSDLPAGRRKHVTAGSLAFRGLARRRSRSVATAALLACGSFLILSIGVFRLDASRDATQRDSGTGGFALIGESTIPVVKDLNTLEGLEFFALDEGDLDGVDFVQFRVRAGDDASCLNLNRAQKPRLLGVNPEEMKGRFTFAKVADGLEADDGWQLLHSAIRNPQSSMEEVPAIGDLNSILWAMHKKVGDTLDYVDDRGRPFKVRIVGAVANSILQGNLVIDETAFVERFPNESGYKFFLMDAPTNRIADLSATLSRALQDYGLEATPAAERLNQFNAVQNTYLGTFQIIGGLGLLLGSAGLGIVVLRNVLERRGELAVLMAVGYRKRMIERLVLIEHAGLLGLGLAIGLMAAAVAVLPTLLSPESQLPYATLLPTLLAVLLNGLAWTWIATRAAIRGNLLGALRNE